jgi:hypothetical protein
MESNDQEVERYTEHLIELGVLRLTSVDSEGEPIFNVDIEKAKEFAPEFLSQHYKDIEDSLISLYERGLVEFDIEGPGKIVWSLTDEGRRLTGENQP